MSTQPIQTPRVRSRDEWRTLMHQFESQDITIKAFCQQHKIAQSTFYKWQSRFRKDGVVSQPRYDDAPQPVAQTKSTDFLNLGAMDLSQSSNLELRLDLGDGVLLTLSRR